MTFKNADRVQETGTVLTGTGAVQLSGAVLGYQSFISGIGNGNTTFYCIYDPTGYLWEVGLGTIASGSPNTLTRTTVYANSAGTQPSLISFSTSDTLSVFNTYPAEIAIYTGASASLNSVATTAAISGSSNTGPYSYGMLSYSDVNIFGSFSANVNSYAQFVLQNTNNGTSASTDFIVSSDGGTATTNYGDFGINSSAFSGGSSALNQPSTVYLYSQSTDLAIGTNSSKSIHFVINGAATDAITINPASSIAFNGQYGSMGQQLVSQGSSTPPIWANAGGTVTVTDFTATSGQTTFSVSYVIGTVSVYRNGIRLGQADFTATNGTSITLATGAIAGDLIEIQSFTTLNIYTNITSQDFSGTGLQTVFTMNSAPGSSAALLVVISGITQDPNNYTVSGTTLTFSTAPAAGTNNISVRYLGQQSTTNVASFSGGTTGFSPTSAATGAVTLSGVLVPANGGTGVNISTSDLTVHGLTVGLGGGSATGNTAVGSSALSANTSGIYNTAIGLSSLALNTAGTSQVSIGAGSLSANTTGNYNTAIGFQSLTANTTASNNTAVGYQAGYTNSTGSYNTFIGHFAGYSSTAGINAFVGDQAGLNVSTGTYNTFIGATNSGYLVTTGSYNTIIGTFSGNQSGLDIRTANNYIVLSDGAGNPQVFVDNSGNTWFGTNGHGASIASGGFVIGGPGNGSATMGHASGTSSGAGYFAFAYNGSTIGSINQAGTTGVLYNITSDYRLKNDVVPIQNALTIIQSLNPVSFTWIDGRNDDGFLAHELQSIIPNCVTGEKDAVNEDGTPKYQQMDNSGVIPFLTKAIQEQQALITDLQARLTKAGL